MPTSVEVVRFLNAVQRAHDYAERERRLRARSAAVGLFLITIALAGLAFILWGCAARQKNITNLPANTTQKQVQNWDTAIANLDKISQITSALRQSVIALNNATLSDATGTGYKIIPDSKTYAGILTSLGKIDQAQLDAAAYLKAQPKNWGASTQTKVKNDIALITTELQTITAQHLPGVKNAGAVQQLQQLITQISSAASVILALTVS